MSVRTARTMIYTAGGLIIVIGIVSPVLGIGLRGGPKSPYEAPILLMIFTLMVLAATLAVFYARCPQCKKSLTSEEVRKLECTTCGQKF